MFPKMEGRMGPQLLVMTIALRPPDASQRAEIMTSPLRRLPERVEGQPPQRNSHCRVRQGSVLCGPAALQVGSPPVSEGSSNKQ